MKKILKYLLILMLALAVIIAITGCGKKEETKAENSAESKKEETKAENSTESKKEETTEQTKEFSLGSWDGKVYKNDFLGLQFNEPEGWSHSTDEEIAKMMNIGKELLNDDQRKAMEISEIENAYYFVANDTNTGDSLSVTSEKENADYTVDFFINNMKKQLTAVESIKYEVLGTEKAKVGNVDCDVLKAKGEYLGVTIYQNYYIYKIDRYFVSIIATTTSSDSRLTEMVSYFK